jgi:hypothetical protein
MYLSIANHLGLHISEPLCKKNSGPPPPATLDLPVSMVVLRGSQAVGLGPHLSHLIYIYKSKITKYMYMVSSRALWKSLVGSFLKPGATSVWRILYPLPEIVIHIFTKAHILFCLPCSRYTRFSPRLACGPPKLMGPGTPDDPPSQWTWLCTYPTFVLTLTESTSI